MADLSDVEMALKALIVGWCYPSGTAQPSAVPGAVPVKVGRGWPVKDTLQSDLAAKVANVSIYSQPGSERPTTRYPREWQTLFAASSTIQVSVSGTVATISGTVTAGLNVALVVNGLAFVYTTASNDTPNSIAAALAAMISGATATGAGVSIPSAHSLVAASGASGTMIRELRRQERLFQITCWCWSPEQRDALAAFLDQKFAGAGDPNGLEFIALPDGTAARLTYGRTAPTDKDELTGAFRRDLIYAVEYATTETATAQQIVAFETKLIDPAGDTLSDTAT